MQDRKLNIERNISNLSCWELERFKKGREYLNILQRFRITIYKYTKGIVFDFFNKHTSSKLQMFNQDENLIE